jgi:hypothetical protein
LIDEEDDGEFVPKKKALKASIAAKTEQKTKPTLSLFSHKSSKSEEKESDEDFVTKRKLKSFGKNPDVNTSFLRDEDIEKEIQKKKLLNQFIKTHMESRQDFLRVRY